MKTEIVYYCYIPGVDQRHSTLYGEEPYPVKKGFTKDRDAKELALLRCPAFTDYINNVYQIGSTHKIDFDVHEDRLTSRTLPQNFFKTVVPHSIKEKIYSVQSQTAIFIAESDSLEMSQEHPYLSDTNWSKTINIMPGKFDIGKYFRNIVFAFAVHNDIETIKVDEGEPLYYLRFHTKKKIKFVRFLLSNDIDLILKDFKFHGEAFHNWKPLKWYYDSVKSKKYKKLLIKKIKENILE